MSPRQELLLVVLVAVGAVEAGALALRAREPVALVPLLAPGDRPEALFAPGGDQQVLRGKLAAVGDVMTVEDLARQALASADQLDPDQAAEVHAAAARIDALRRELLTTEDALRAAEAALDEQARGLFRALTPDQRQWLLDHRNEVSVGRVEDAYWAELLEATAP